MRDRVNRLFGQLKAPADCILFYNSVNPHLDLSFFYVTDLAAGLFEGCAALAFPDGTLEILSSPLEAETARTSPQAGVETFRSKDEFHELLRRKLGDRQRIGLNFHELTHEGFLGLQKALPGADFVDVSDAVRRARGIKDAREVEKLREAGRIGSRVAEAIPGLLREGMTELELAGEIEYQLSKFGGAGRSFDTIVAFGPHGAEPHYAPQSTRLNSPTSMVCDFGALHKHYCSDITRSFAWGSPDRRLKEIHQIVEAAQQEALATLRPGVPAKEVHGAAQRVIDASPYKGLFTHGLGHSIGLAVHDGFSMNARSEEPLEVGMCLTVEPGIYVLGLGGVRIEDDVLITEKGYEFLTTAPRGYLEVG